MPFKKIKDVLRQNNLRPTNQIIAIFNILFKEENWHFSADIVEKKCSEKGIRISAGTIYNVLNDFYAKGLISKVMIDDDRSWFDTNTSDHFHNMIPRIVNFTILHLRILIYHYLRQ